MFRQGDVLLVPIAEIPKFAAPIPGEREEGRLILARGEMTGHHHSVDNATEVWSGHGKTYLRLSEPTTLQHQEHDPIKLDKGLYEVRLQQQYHPTIQRRAMVD